MSEISSPLVMRSIARAGSADRMLSIEKFRKTFGAISWNARASVVLPELGVPLRTTAVATVGNSTLAIVEQWRGIAALARSSYLHSVRRPLQGFPAATQFPGMLRVTM